jgi:copper chaperone NosL
LRLREEVTVKTFLERSHRLLSSPVSVTPRALALAAALLLLPTYFFPLWNLTMFAPQYGGGLRLDIYGYKLEGGNQGQDLKEINLLNHYIGMRDLAADDFTEFKWMPFVLGALALLFLRAAVVGRVLDLVDSFVLFGYFGLFSLWSFAYKLYRYGHDLAPTAPVKVPPFMPPLFGGQQLANFEVYSYPSLGSWALVGAGLALLVAITLAARAGRRARLVAEAALPGPAPGAR